ncbi:MAG: hypothetical protein ACD_8C00012G0006 [uncultured bacterium]|nr:MAG: hypothetical protein ACD_8C00012G0006 [uncultured bacterium]
MNQKIKMTIIILILLATVGVLVFLIAKSKEKTPIAVQPQTVQTETPINRETDPSLVVIEREIPNEIEGRVVGISRTMIVIDDPAGAYELNLKNETKMTSSIDGGEPKKINLMNLKAGLTVSVKVDSSTKDVLELVVIKEK